MAKVSRSTRSNSIPPLVTDEDADPKCFMLKPAQNLNEVVKLWSRIGFSEREGHERVIKINILAPFLFGSNDPSILSEEWIEHGYRCGMLPQDIIIPSQVETMSKVQMEATELIDKTCDNIIPDKVKLGAVLEVYEHLSHKHVGSLEVRISQLQRDDMIMRWRDGIGRECKSFNLDSINEKKVLFTIAYVIQHYAYHMIAFTKGERNLKEEFQDVDASGDTAKMSSLKEEGNRHFREKKYRNAVTSYTKALAYGQYNHVLYGNRAQAYLKLGRCDQALSDSYRSIVLKPTWPKGHYRYVEALMDSKRYHAAHRANVLGLQKCPMDKDLRAQREKINGMLVSGGKARVNVNISVKKNKDNKDNPELAGLPDGFSINKQYIADLATGSYTPAPPIQNSKPEKAKPQPQQQQKAQQQPLEANGDPQQQQQKAGAQSKKKKKNRGKSKENRSESQSRTESSSGSVIGADSKKRKKSVTKTTRHNDSGSDVPELVSDDNDDVGDSDDEDRTPPGNDTDDENKPRVDELIHSWMKDLNQNKKKKETIEKPAKPVKKENVKSPGVDALVLSLRQGSEALIAAHQGASQAAVAVENYQEAVVILERRSTKVVDIINYCLGMAFTLKGRDSDINLGIKLFEKIKTIRFPLAYLGLVRAYLLQNRYEKAIEPAREGLKVIEKHDFKVEFYPETSTAIPESHKAKFKVELQLLLQTAQCPPKPDAVCRYHDCSGHYKIFIYYSDPDFKGFVRVLCYSKCVIEFHLECWKKFKSSSAERQSDKDIANGECFTPDCHSAVWKIVFVNEAKEVMKEISGNEPLNAIIDAPPKKVLKIPSSSLYALKRKADRKALRKQKKKEKKEVELRNNNMREDAEMRKMSEGSTGTYELRDEDKSSMPTLGELTMLKKDETSPSKVYMVKGKPSAKTKKGKKKEKGKVVMTLGEFTSNHEGEEEVFTPEPVAVPPTSSMGLDDFGDYGLSERRFNLLDPTRPFSVPSNLEDEIKNFESAYSGTVPPSVGSPGPVVAPPSTNPKNRPQTDPTPSSHNAVSTSSSVADSGSVAQKEKSMKDIKETIYSVFANLLEESGPIHIYDRKILDELDNFPQPAMELIQKSGNIGRFLIQSLKFAMIDEFVCLMFDAVKARDIADEYRELVNHGMTPLAPPPVVKFAEQDFPTIGATKGASKSQIRKEKTEQQNKLESMDAANHARTESEQSNVNNKSNLTQPVNDFIAKAKSLAQSMAPSASPVSSPLNLAFASSSFPTSACSVPPGFAPSVPSSSSSAMSSASFSTGSAVNVPTGVSVSAANLSPFGGSDADSLSSATFGVPKSATGFRFGAPGLTPAAPGLAPGAPGLTPGAPGSLGMSGLAPGSAGLSGLAPGSLGAPGIPPGAPGSLGAPGLAPGSVTAPSLAPGSTPFGAPSVFSGIPSSTHALSGMKWDSIQVFSGSDSSQPPLPSPLPNSLPPSLSSFQFGGVNTNSSPTRSTGLDAISLDDASSNKSKSPGVIGSGTPTRNRVDMTDVSPDPNGPSSLSGSHNNNSRMFSLWQGAGIPDANPDQDKASMLDDVDDDDTPVETPSYNIWSQENKRPLAGSDLPPFPTFSSWEGSKSSLFDTINKNPISSTDKELVDDIARSVTEELKDSPFVRYNNTDIAANVKADILNDLHKGSQLRTSPGSPHMPTGRNSNPPVSTSEVGVNTTDNFLAAYAEIHSQYESQSEELKQLREQLMESVKMNEINAEQLEDLKSRNTQLEESQVVQEDERQRYANSAAATSHKLTTIVEELNETRSSNKQLQAQIEHLIEQHQKQEARIKELEKSNAQLQSESADFKESVRANEERAKTSELNYLKFKSDVGAEVLERSAKEAQTHMENLQKSQARWTQSGESVPLVVQQGIEEWEKTVNGIKRKISDAKTEFEDQMNQIKEGTPLSSLPKLPVPRPPPPPDANLMREIMMVLHRKASPPPSSNTPPLLNAPPGVKAKQPVAPPAANPTNRPPGFGLPNNRPSTPPVAKPTPILAGSPISATSSIPASKVAPPPGLTPALGATSDQKAPPSGSWGAGPSIASVVAAGGPPVAPPSVVSGGAWSTVTSKKGQNKQAPANQQKGSSFNKMMMLMEQLYPNIPSDKLHDYIQEVRASRGGSLSGLSINEVISLASERISTKQENTPAAKPVASRPQGGGAAAGLSDFDDGSQGGASSHRNDIVMEEVDPCPICHEELSHGPVSPLECGHKFHDDCIRKWFREQSTCPTCRVHALLPDDFPRLG